MSFKNISKVLSLIGMTVSIIFLLDILVGLIYDEDFKKFLLYDVVFFTEDFKINRKPMKSFKPGFFQIL